MKDIIDPPKENRKHPRKNCLYLPVDFVYDNRLLRGLIMDISERGARIENTVPLHAGVRTTLTFMENNPMGPVKAQGRVVRSFENGFAVNFEILTKNQEDMINYIVEKCDETD
jgi:hypothetical protein